MEKMRKSGKTRKRKVRKKMAEQEKKPFPPFFFFLFSCSRFLGAADPTISEPGQAVRPLALYSKTVTRKPVD